jgi:hypothetical protein
MRRGYITLAGAVLLSILAFSPSASAAETKLVGSATVESQTDAESAGTAEAFSQTATASGMAETAYLYIGASNAAKTVVVGIYSNVLSHPGILLSTGTAKATAVGTWTSVPLAHLSITAGTIYWLAIMGEGGALHYRDHPAGTCKSETSSQAGMNAFVASWKTGGSYKDCPGSVYVTTGATAPPPPPVNSVLPVISGSVIEGQTLSGSSGTWSGAPTSYAYQWLSCNALGEACVNAPGGTSLTFELTSANVGGTVRFSVTSSNPSGSTTATSTSSSVVTAAPPPPPPVAPVNTALPLISGSAVQGQTLTASTGAWSGSPTSYAYQWQDCNALGEGCLGINGATTSTYKLLQSDVAGTVRVVLSATNSGGTGVASSSPSALVAAIPPPPPPPVNSVLPVISGSVIEGQTLSGSSGTWSGAPTSYAYQWLSCNALGEACVNAPGGTSLTFELTSANVGGTVRFSVTSSNPSGSTTATSTSSSVVTAAPPPPPGEQALLMGIKVAHSNGGDAKAEELTPLKFTALKSGTVESLYFEAGGYKYAPSETSLVLGIQESVAGKPGKVLGQGTITGTLGLNAVGKVGGLSVPITAGTTYYLTFLPLGGSITYWYSKAETVIYSEHHKLLEEGPPEKYEWKEEAQEAPIGMWAEGTTH